MDVHKYVRKVNIKHYLLSNPIKGNRVTIDYVLHSNFSNTSLFNPPGGLAPSLKVFQDVVLRDLDTIKIQNTQMQKDLEQGLDKLCTNKELVIQPADKGGGELSY